MKNVAVAIAILVVSQAACGASPLQKQHNHQGAAAVSFRNRSAVMRYLRPVLRANHRTALLYYSATCGDSPDSFEFPEITMQPPPREKAAIASITRILRGNRQVAVIAGRSGVIKIRIGTVPPSLLATRISRLRFKPIEQYNPDPAISALENTREVRTAMRVLRVRPLLTVRGSELLSPPAPGSRHLPPLMKNVTVNQVLESIAQTFQGVVTYGLCMQSQGSGLVSISFVGVAGPLANLHVYYP